MYKVTGQSNDINETQEWTSPDIDQLDHAKTAAEQAVKNGSRSVRVWQLHLSVSVEERTIFRQPNGREG